MAMLAIYKRTGLKEYLQAAEFAGHYIMSLQILDQREPRYYGVIREITSQSIEFAPRDATTAAWALLWLYNTTQNPVYLDRAILFANWHLEYGMHDGWPLYACYMDIDITDMYWLGAFQSGTGLFYYDMFMATGDVRYIDKGLRPIAFNYRDKFFEDDGKIILNRDGFTGEIIHGKSVSDVADMHLYNDDFGNAMLLAAADFFKDESLRECAYRNILWLVEHQLKDGTFGQMFPSGVPVSLMYFHRFSEYYENNKLLIARDKALEALLKMQFIDVNMPKANGAILEVDVNSMAIVHSRTTCYAVMALLLLEGKLCDIWLGAYNKRFVDPAESRGIPHLIW
jgi:hypothetical protein